MCIPSGLWSGAGSNVLLHLAEWESFMWFPDRYVLCKKYRWTGLQYVLPHVGLECGLHGPAQAVARL